MPGDDDGVIDLTRSVVGLYRSGEAREIERQPGPPPRIDGYTVGAPRMTREPPHEGERHPDGDELLILISGRITVLLEDRDPPRRVELTPGRALVVPKGVWHRVLLSEPSQLVNITPGPSAEWRLPGRGA